ncbi:hypothetical protein ABZS66_11200 [Dactylosporangium sp. NPDC005572]|uniref:hypothetical protein n=1 Tax=Dactylosporangium sp. NPDC005572 TaxID=3156889 RepID=UPI0033B29283
MGNGVGAPLEVRTLAVVQYLMGAGGLAGAALLVWAASVVARKPSYGGPDTLTAAQAIAILAAAALVAGGWGGLALVLGRRLRQGRPWARTVSVVLGALVLAGVVTLVVAGWPMPVPAYLLAASYPLLCLALPNTAAAREWFRPS